MTTLNTHVDTLAGQVLSGSIGLDDALTDLDGWLAAYADRLSDAERKQFSATLDQETTNDNYSLVDSILRLHTTRVLYCYDLDRSAASEDRPADPTPYSEARARFTRALRQSERGIHETRIDIAIANAHHLLGNPDANRRWLQRALDHLPDLAAINLVALAENIPPMPLPRMGPLKRLGLKVIGFNFEELSSRNLQSLVALAQMQTDQLVIMAHLLGTSFEAIRERQRSRRALRIAAHLVTRHGGLYTAHDVAQLVNIAETLAQPEPDAAHVLAQQALALGDPYTDDDLLARARALLGQ